MALRAILPFLLAAILSAGCISDIPTAEHGTHEDLEQADGSSPEQGTDEEPAQTDDASPGQASPEGQQAADPDASPTTPDDPLQADPPTGPNAGSPTAHGDAKRTDGPVDIRTEGGQYYASRLVTIENDFGGADLSHLVLSSFNGAISLQPSSDGGYLFTAELFGRGATEQDARQALDVLELEDTDELDGSKLALSFKLIADPPAPLPVPIELPSSVTNGAMFKLWVPSEPAHDVEAETANAAIGVSGLHGPRLDAGSANAAIQVDGAWDRIEARTSNAAIGLGGGTINDILAESSNGAISAEVDPSRSAAVKLATSNSAISVSLQREAGTAFDITADTLNARVSIEVEDHDSTDDNHGEYRSPSWSSAAVQLTLDLDTSNAAIAVED